MSTTDDPPLDSVNQPVNWHQVYQTLDAEQYERVTELLQQIQVPDSQNHVALALKQILVAVRQISETLTSCHAETIWLQQAYERATQRELSLKQQLQTLLETVSLLTPPTTQATTQFQTDPEIISLSPTLPIPSQQPSLPAPSLTVYSLGVFQVYLDDQPVTNWSSGKGKAIFKYLIINRQQPTGKEVLMDLFWPGANPDAARNNLNVAIYGLRQTLRKIQPDCSHIVFEQDKYVLNPELQIWVDVEAFMAHQNQAQILTQQGAEAEAIQAYRAAEALYGGEFLAEDPYEEWPLSLRRQIQNDYLKILDLLSRFYLIQADYNACLAMCNKILAIDTCHEGAHRRSMQSYSRLGQRHMALRQYHLCLEVLSKELDIDPGEQTTALYTQIRQRETV